MNHDSLMRAAPVSFNFTSQLSNLKNTLTLWEDVVSKTMKLSAALRTVIQCIAGFLEAFQKIADCAYGSNCGLRELGSCMTRFCLRERGLESRLRTFNSQLMDCLAQPLSDRLEEWRRTVAQLERENNKEWRRARSELQRVTSEVDKLNKRFRRKGSSSSTHRDLGSNGDSNAPNPTQIGENVQLNFVQHDLAVKRRTLAELERANLRRAVVEERRRFAELLTCLKPVLDSQTAIFSDVGSIDECIAAISKHVCDPNELSSDTEQAVEEAADQVSASRGTYERKLSDVRSVMRFGKGGNTHSFDAMSLRRAPGHCSQLSLQSSVSATTNTWNSTVSSTGTAPRSGRRCPSPINVCSGMEGGEPRTNPQSPTSLSTTTNGGTGTAIGGATDSFSLFEHADPTQPSDEGSVGRNQLDCAINENNSNNTSHVDAAQSGYASGVGLNGVEQTQFSPSMGNHTASGQPEEDEEEEDGDVAGAGDGGATTEDTEDGETEDDERFNSTDGAADEDKPASILYPNQAIPAPVYTNLNELKRAAARKFRNAEAVNNNFTGQLAPRATQEDSTSCLTTSPSDSMGQISPYATASTGADLRRPISEAYAAMGLEPRSPKPPSGQVSAHLETPMAPILSATMPASTLPPQMVDSNGTAVGYAAYSPSPNEGFITTQVNSGTSTFRRRQSEYAKRHPPEAFNSSTGLGHMSRIMNYASATPAIVRRGSQACTEASSRGSGRPTNPPRRSSSVSREFNRARHSAMPEHFSASQFAPPIRPNGFEHPGIQRVSSSIFTHSDQVLATQGTNGTEHWPTANVHGSRPNLIQLPPGTMMKPSAMSITSVTPPSFFAEAPAGRGDRAKGMPLTPPPLATVAAPTHTKTNQLMFGVKVLPSQIPTTQLDSTIASTVANYGTSSRQSGPHRYNADNSSGQYASASRLHRMPMDDGSTSFIE